MSDASTLSPNASRGPRILFYSHDGMGLGHVRRNLSIAAALVEQVPNADILLVSGTNEVHRLDIPPRTGVLKLPSLRKIDNETYQGRSFALPRAELIRLRSSLIESAVKRFAPQVLVSDKHPLGVGGELKAALKACRRYGGRTVLGLRDILDEPERVRADWKKYKIVKTIQRLYDRVLIYGDREVFNTVDAYRLPASVREKTVFCGYVHGSPERHIAEPAALAFPESGDQPLVLATFGAGEDALPRLEAFIRACVNAPWRGVAVAGPQAKKDICKRLASEATQAGVTLFDYVHNVSDWFSKTDALVCMGGYNTLVEAVVHNVPVVCIPRVHPRVEQRMRADAFAWFSQIEVVPESADPAPLRKAIEDALANPSHSQTSRRSMRLNGAAEAAAELVALIATAGSPATEEIHVA